ncbi:uncharacterized protein LOC128556206 [Mercenaria mercenaria]|uniref:uncharacterized protein LOC128556206 n=1 Tax=Mercenaria mercenaria TaxID=6596 RepID=UPI00234EA2B9|nr:uncharacterized protein LOC128556206 [Mercenaria mercenaria]
MQDTCNIELDRNSTVRQYLKDRAKDNDTKSGNGDGQTTTESPVQNLEDTVIDEIRKHSCLNNCSDHGNCVNGACSCDNGYGASDCSIDMAFPPRIEGLLDDGFCDEINIPCSYLYVFGEVFVGKEVICRLLEFQIDTSSKKTFELQHTFVEGIADSLIEAVCDLRQLKSQKRENDQVFVRGYQVSMSNDGEHYSTEHMEFYLFDSTCQIYFKDGKGIRFALREGFCFIEQSCFANGTVDKSEKRYCDTGLSNYSWTNIPTTTTKATTTSNAPITSTIAIDNSLAMETTNTLTDLNIGLISATTFAFIISIILAIILCRCARRKENPWKKLRSNKEKEEDSDAIEAKVNANMFSNPVYNEMHD